MQNATPPTVFSLWIGDSLPPLAELCIRSYLDYGIRFELYTYHSLPNVPERTTVRNAADILPEDLVFTHFTGSYAPFADWFRYAVLAQHGGFWTDLDIVCLNHGIPRQTPWYAREDSTAVANSAISFPPGHPVILDMLRLSEDPAAPMPWVGDEQIERIRTGLREIADPAERRKQAVWGLTGPLGFTLALAHHGIIDQAAARDTAYPVHYPAWRNCYNGTINLDSPELANAWAIHLWGELLRREPETLANITPDSLVSQLMARHNVTLSPA